MSLQTQPHTISLASTRFTSSIERRVRHYIRKHRIIAEGDHVIVAVSGGPDSSALLVILARLASELRLDITVAHFDHQLRTEEEAAADLDFVQSLAASLGLPLAHANGDVRAQARRLHLSIEDAARRLRYAFLSEQAAGAGATCVAVGHTLDDQAETILLHLIRGAGLTGIGGMRPLAPSPFNSRADLARPLLSLRREETVRYCREIGITPRTDPTNDLPTAARNRVRHEVMPTLRVLNPRIEEALARFADAAVSEIDYLDELATQAFNALATSPGSTVALPRRALSALPRPLAARVIRLAFARAHGTAAGLEAPHIEAILDALRGPPSVQSLTGGITAVIDPHTLTLSDEAPAFATPISETPLTVSGRTIAGHWLIEAQIVPVPSDPSTAIPTEAYLDAAKSGTELCVRSRRPGDRLRPLGLGGERKLQDILVDAKVPARHRDAVPLVCAGDQIAWVVGHCIDERFALDPASRQAIHLLASVAHT